MLVYRAPFPTPVPRRPIWRFPNDLPDCGENLRMCIQLWKKRTVLSLSQPIRSCFSLGIQGALISPAYAESFAKSLKNCRVVQLSSGIHYLQEDHPDLL